MVQHPWRLGPYGERVLDVGLVLVLLVPVPVLVVATLPDHAVLSALQIVPLLWRRRRPAATFAAVAAASALQVLVLDEATWGQVAFPLAVYAAARHGSRPTAWVALAVGAVATVVATVDWLPWEAGAQAFTPYLLSIGGITAVAWTLGLLGRIRSDYIDSLLLRGHQLEREVEQQAALAALEERSRIARELHDVVAHGLSTIVVQADGARYAAAKDPAVAAATLETVARTGREALTDMRRMLGLLRAEETGTAPLPTLADLTALVEGARGAGTPVELEVEGDLASLPESASLTGFRVVQEALTNVRKHAGPGARAQVRVEVGPDFVVRVRDDGRGAASSTPDDGAGLGLRGMRERVAVHEGEVTAGPVTGGGFAVCARIPW